MQTLAQGVDQHHYGLSAFAAPFGGGDAAHVQHKRPQTPTNAHNAYRLHNAGTKQHCRNSELKSCKPVRLWLAAGDEEALQKRRYGGNDVLKGGRRDEVTTRQANLTN